MLHARLANCSDDAIVIFTASSNTLESLKCLVNCTLSNADARTYFDRRGGAQRLNTVLSVCENVLIFFFFNHRMCRRRY